MGFADVVAEKFKPVCLPKESLEYLNKPRALEAANFVLHGLCHRRNDVPFGRGDVFVVKAHS